MDIDFDNGNLLNIAKRKAIDIIQSYPSEKNFYLVTNDFEAKNNASYTSDIIQFQIEKIRSSPKQRSITDIISRVNSINSDNTHLYFISDFQKKTLQINGLKELNIANQLSLIPIKNNNLKKISLKS